MSSPIAIVGMACRYPDARSVTDLWENVLARRRAFRRMPPERLNLEDYFEADSDDPDKIYSQWAAVLEDYEFDRVRFRVGGETFRVVDMTHWLALDVTSGALADAGFDDGAGLPRERTGVLIGNTLAGEFSRANVMRLRWPYVRRVLSRTLSDGGWSGGERRRLLEQIERDYKSSFPEVNTESLAGGLANTIAGRICNYYDLSGGGYSVDGACSSSLLAVSNACTSLQNGDLDVAIVGGVDLSLDPFELVGFSRVGALSRTEMRVYDRRSDGFWPGEGCGILVLMRHSDAVARGARCYARIAGWGISSDGSGGITRPEVRGQLLALERAYSRARIGVESLAYIEGHGTGTPVGDTTELKALSELMRSSRNGGRRKGARPAIGSVKANIGHTKAAAGVAGIIKAAMVVENRLIPPHIISDEPHELLRGSDSELTVSGSARALDARRAFHVGVSSMGFGGVNVHLVLGTSGEGSSPLGKRTRVEASLAHSYQDSELFVFAGENRSDLRSQIERVSAYADRLSWAELGDLAKECVERLGRGAWRSAVVASSPKELSWRLERMQTAIVSGQKAVVDTEQGCFLGQASRAPKIGFLFPGQASPSYLDGGAWGERFRVVDEWYSGLSFDRKLDSCDTELAQPAIVGASLAGIKVIEALGISAARAVGHSVGEWVALCWAGAFDPDMAMQMVRLRGRMMAHLGEVGGAMASVAADEVTVQSWIERAQAEGIVTIGAVNGPEQTVVSGSEKAVVALCGMAESAGIKTRRLNVSNAFHSPLMARAEAPFRKELQRFSWNGFRGGTVASSVTGELLSGHEDLWDLLVSQLRRPVRFQQALDRVDGNVDLWLEVGPGNVLTRLAETQTTAPVIGMDVAGKTVRGLLDGVGAAFTMGAALDLEALFRDRFFRPFDLDWNRRFLESPCELVPRDLFESRDDDEHAVSEAIDARSIVSEPSYGESDEGGPDASCESVVYSLIAEATELPASAIGDENRLLGDLHLNSITVGQLIAKAAKRLKLTPPKELTRYADATVGQVIEALQEIGARAGVGSDEHAEDDAPPSGVAEWCRAFVVKWLPRPLPLNARGTIGADSEQRQGWEVIGRSSSLSVEKLRAAFADAGLSGPGIVCVPPSCWRENAGVLLDAARRAIDFKGRCGLVLALQGDETAGAGFVKTLHLEQPEVAVRVIYLPDDASRGVDWIVAEAWQCDSGFEEVKYDDFGNRWAAILEGKPTPSSSGGRFDLGPDDVVLVTGGGKGIGAECALALAKETGARLAMVGRSEVDESAELQANLERMRHQGVTVRYLQADVTDVTATAAAIRRVVDELGAVTAILHSAGLNEPTPITALAEEKCLATLAPKVGGLDNVLSAIEPRRLRAVIGFGSIIGRIGLEGEADYALANEWLTSRINRLQARYPECRCLCLEWSVWAGVGMGQRLGSVEVLARKGVVPLTLDQGVSMFLSLLRSSLACGVVVTSRFGSPPTIELEPTELPLWRFVEVPRVHYPGVELVVDVDLSAGRDRYLNDHVIEGNAVLPAVVGLEAMTQVASVLVGSDEPPVLEDVALPSPVVVPAEGTLTIRVAALRRDAERVDVVLREERSGFAEDCFRARCRFANDAPHPNNETMGVPPFSDEARCAAIEIDPVEQLYGGLLFHSGRFMRIQRYEALSAESCRVRLLSTFSEQWFVKYLPQRLILGDPGLHDAAIHAIQACIPHERLLPVGIERWVPGCSSGGPSNQAVVTSYAYERARDGEYFVYDVTLFSDDGVRMGTWQGLTLKRVGRISGAPWRIAGLLRPYLERRLDDLVPGGDFRAVLRGNGSRSRGENREPALREVIGGSAVLTHRPDGKPELDTGTGVSISYTEDWTLVVVGKGAIGCDIEPVRAEPTVSWSDLLDERAQDLARLLTRKTGEPYSVSATRVWTALEALKKAGHSTEVALRMEESTDDHWVVFESGSARLASLHHWIHSPDQTFVLTVCLGASNEVL